MNFLSLSLKLLRSSRLTIGFVLTLSAFLLGIVVLLHLGRGVPIGVLTRDPLTVARVPLYTGFLSQIGIFFWSAATAICLYSAKLIAKRPKTLMVRRFLFASGWLTLLLGVDDAFLLHDGILPMMGIPQKVVLASYPVLILLYLTRFVSVILKTEYVLLGMALFFFAISMALDVMPIPGINPFFLRMAQSSSAS